MREQRSSRPVEAAAVGNALSAGDVAQLASGARVRRYQILAVVGRGGMGEVYAAYHPDLDRRIALKIVYGAAGADSARQARLLREARIIARLDHPNIVAVHDAGMFGCQVYLAMEFVDGQTLDVWLRDKSRRWQEIVEVFLAAGNGLAAAHTANVVHRDFKPQNVMIGRDGRVRVMDFGLARSLSECDPLPAGAPAGAGLSTTSTTVGALRGTPAYMAPEQLRGERADVRADQFSFCVAFHEAIYGFRPGVPPQQSTGRPHRVPAWLKNVVRRGLEPAADRRFRSMNALLAAVERGRRRVHRLWLLFAAVALLLAATAAGARLSRGREFACVPPQDRIDAVWPQAEAAGSRRAAIHRSFLQSGVQGAEATWQKVAAILDDRVRRWANMYRESCEMTHVRGEQSTQVMDLRSACLAETLDETRAYTDRLLGAGSDGLGRALVAANLLDPIQRCADVNGLRMEVPPPRDPRVRAEVEHLRQKLNDADVLVTTLQVKSAFQQLDQVLEAARTLGYKPLLAQTLEVLGSAQTAAEQFAQAAQSFHQSLFDAEASRDDLTAAKSAIGLAFVAVMTARVREARVWLSLGESVLERANARGSLIGGWFFNDRGVLGYTEGDFAAAEADFRSAISVKAALLGTAHPDVARSLANLAMALEEQDRAPEALQNIHRALAIEERAGGEGGLPFANSLQTQGELLVRLGEADAAEDSLRRALRIERDAGAESVLAVVTLVDWGELMLLRHRPEEAVTAARQAAVTQQRFDDRDTVRLATTRFLLGRALVESGAARGEGRGLVAEACAGFKAAHFELRQRQTLAWFNALPGRHHQASSCLEIGTGHLPVRGQ